MDRFADPILLLLALTIPVVAIIRRRGRSAAITHPVVLSLPRIGRTWRVRMRVLLPVLRSLAVLGLVVALARPQRNAGQLQESAEGIAMEIVVDRSASMLEPMDAREVTGPGQPGVGPSKFDVVKRLVGEFLLGNGEDLLGRPNDLVGLVTFGRYADTVAPLARSLGIVTQLAQQLTPANVRGEDGTAIGEGLALAAARLRDAEHTLEQRAAKDKSSTRSDATAAGKSEPGPAFKVKSKVIILMTDGQNNAGSIEPMQAAELAKEWGIKVYTIGVGAGERFGRISTLIGDRMIPMGNAVDERMLTAIAKSTGGEYFAASDSKSLREIYRTIDRLEKTDLESPRTTRWDELFVYPAALAGVLLGAERLLALTMLRRVP